MEPQAPVSVVLTLHMPGTHLPSLFQCPHVNVRKAAHEALGQFCCALHKAHQKSSSEAASAGEETPAGWERWELAGPDYGSGQFCLQLCSLPWLE